MLHTALGGAATVSALKSGARGSRLHLRENSTFWIKRVTGVAILLMAFYHFSVYTGVEDGEFVLKEFTAFRMATQIIFVLVIFIHIFVSVKGMLVAGGVVKFRERMWDWISRPFDIHAVFLHSHSRVFHNVEGDGRRGIK